jgi:hypothetical protein
VCDKRSLSSWSASCSASEGRSPSFLGSGGPHTHASSLAEKSARANAALNAERAACATPSDRPRRGSSPACLTPPKR